MVDIIGGIPGVGKTTVLEALKTETNLGIVNFGTLMLERSGLRDRDELREIPLEKQRVLQSETALRIERLGRVLVDTHYSIKTRAGYLPGIPPWVLEVMHVDKIIVIEADAREIENRRAKDGSRMRNVETLEEIEKHQSMNRSFAVVLSQLKGAALSIVKNRAGGAEECAVQIKKILEV